jgi:hypothetical protein
MGGLMTHDYLVHALGRNPIDYARSYYLHLPYFAVGVWPPLFYLLEAGWMALFGERREAVLWLIAVSAAGLGTLAYHVLRKQYGAWSAAAGSAIFLLIPVVQQSACLVMVDLTCSLFAFAAIIFFARYLERQRWQDSALSGLFCGMALLTKNSTYFILLIPPLVILAARRWDLLRRPALWIAPTVAGCLYVPWLLLSRPFLLLGIHGLKLPGFFGIQRDYLLALWREMPLLIPPALAGTTLLLRKGRKRSALAMCMLAALPATSVGIFAARVPVQERLLMVSYIAVIFLANECWTALLGPSKAAAAMAACLLAFGAMNWMRFSPPPVNHIRGVVRYLQARDGSRPGAVVAPSGAEGPWIAEFAQTEAVRPLRVILRPTKVFGEEDWNGSNWRPYYTSTAEIEAFFRRAPVKYCIVARGTTGRKYPHDSLLRELVTGNPGWRQLIFKSEPGSAAEYLVYENRAWTPQAEAGLSAQLSRLRPGSLP